MDHSGTDSASGATFLKVQSGLTVGSSARLSQGVEAVEAGPEREFCAMPTKYDLIERGRVHAKFFGGANAYPK